MRKKIIAGNWKMNKSLDEAVQFVEEAVATIKTNDTTEAIVCAPSVYLATLVEKAKGSDIHIAAQNMHEADSGAFTGEVSPAMLKSIGVSHVVLGHSERREYYNETNETVNKKTLAAFEHGLLPIVCVGETLEQREAEETLAHIKTQVTVGLQGLTEEQITNTIIAYEPIWAIGTGKTASSTDANDVCAHVRKVVSELSSPETAEKVVIQYGGSVNPSNIEELLATSDIDGGLVGGASMEVDSFAKLVTAGNNA